MPWCPDSQGFGPACPSPTDPPSASYCCSIPWNGVQRPSCCTFPVYTGLIIVLPAAAAAAVALLVFLICHCWPGSPMNRRKSRLRNSSNERSGMEMMQRFDREPLPIRQR